MCAGPTLACGLRLAAPTGHRGLAHEQEIAWKTLREKKTKSVTTFDALEQSGYNCTSAHISVLNCGGRKSENPSIA
jgi:hypothetical protein